MNSGRRQGWGPRSTAVKPAARSGSQRPEWVRAISEGRGLGLTLTPEQGLRLRESVRSLSAEGFPVEAGAAARPLAEAFLLACNGFELAAGNDAQRRADARAITALAEALDTELADIRTAEAARARYGERD